ARGPDGNLWFGDFTSQGGVVKITPGGTVTEYPRNLRSGTFTAGITAGPDGNLWFTESAGSGRITKLTPAGEMTIMAYGGEHPAARRGDRVRGAVHPARPEHEPARRRAVVHRARQPRCHRSHHDRGRRDPFRRGGDSGLHGRPRADRDHYRRGRQRLVHRGW